MEKKTIKKIAVLVLLAIIAIGLYCYFIGKNKKQEEINTSTKIEALEKIEYPEKLTIKGLAQNPEGIEFDKNDNTFLLSSLNAKPIIKVNLDGTFKAFTSGEKFPLSTTGLQVDYKENRLLVAGFNGTELFDGDSRTKGGILSENI